MKKELPKRNFSKFFTMEREHAIIDFFLQKIERAINFRKSHRASLELHEFHQSSKQLKSARPHPTPPPVKNRVKVKCSRTYFNVY